MKVGIDIVECDRFLKISRDDSKLNKLFTENEINHFKKSNNYLPRLAGIYCAKEAFLKAVGVGVKNGIDFLEIEINYESSGKPYFVFKGEAKLLVNNLNNPSIDVSISHTDNLATAICIIG